MPTVRDLMGKSFQAAMQRTFEAKDTPSKTKQQEKADFIYKVDRLLCGLK